MASKDNKQRNNEDNRINRAGTTISNQGMKKLQSSPMFQRKQTEHDAPSSNSRSNNKKTQSKSSSTRSNNSNKKNKSSTSKKSSVNSISSGQPTLSNASMKELKNGPKFKRKQSEYDAPSSNLSDPGSQGNDKKKSSTETDKSNSINNNESPNRAPKKRSKIKKVLDKFTDIIKRPTKTIKSSLGMNNQKTMSHVDKLRNQRNSNQSKKSTHGR